MSEKTKTGENNDATNTEYREYDRKFLSKNKESNHKALQQNIDNVLLPMESNINFKHEDSGTHSNKKTSKEMEQNGLSEIAIDSILSHPLQNLSKIRAKM